MINVLISNKDVSSANSLVNMLANDKDYVFEITSNGTDTISIYNKINPDILVLDDNISDLPIENIIDRLSSTPIDSRKCNIVLTLEPNLRTELNNVEKISKMIYKPIDVDKLIASIKKTASQNNHRPDLSEAEVSLFLRKLNSNCLSSRL